MDSKQAYTSPVGYHPVHMDAVVVFCSDGRISEACHDFLTTHIGLRDYDRVKIPGGPGALAGEAAGLLTNIRMLVEMHSIDRVILIQHEDCGYYHGLYGVKGEDEQRLQTSDLRLAVQRVRDQCGVPNVEGYIVRRCGEGTVFDQVTD